MKVMICAAVMAFIILQASAVYAVEESWETITMSGQLVTDVDLSSTFEIKKNGADPSIQYLKLNLSLIPRNDGLQEVRSIETNPSATVEEGHIFFRWDDPGFGKRSFSVESEVRTRNDFVPVKQKVAFPITGISEDLKIFTQNSSTIDSNDPEIIALASSLADGEDDLFVVVYKLAEWSNRNIEYNLSTLTEEVTRSASWVLQNRIGVCDELTNLFVAMNRALGIPARYIHGVAYTNSKLFTENWGFHGWAEVYFPGHGWIPFDPTYGQYGNVDAGHIKMRTSIDALDYSITYNWRGTDVNVEVQNVDVEVRLKEASGQVSPTVELSSQVLKNPVDSGSYNVEEVTIKNLKDHYVVTELRHWTTNGTKLIGDTKRAVLLKPGEVKKEYFIFRVTQEIRPGYIWTFPMTVKSLYESTETDFKAQNGADNFTLEEIKDLIPEETEEEQEEEEIIQSGSVELDCMADRAEIYVYEDANVTCTATNTGNAALNNLQFCHNQCQNFTLSTTESRNFTFLTDFNSPGNNNAEASIKGQASASASAYVNVLDEPAIAITGVSHPRRVTHNETYVISFTAKKASVSVPLNVTVSIEPAERTFNYTSLQDEERITASMNASDLQEGINSLRIVARFRDGNGRNYSETKRQSIKVGNETSEETTEPEDGNDNASDGNADDPGITGRETAQPGNVTLDCMADRAEIYVYEDANVTCTATNTGNAALNNLQFCHNQCQNFTLSTTESRNFTFLTDFNSPGNNNAEASIKGQASASASAYVNVLDEPAITLTEVSHPEKVSHNELYEISFMAKRTSDSVPLEVRVTIDRSDIAFRYSNLQNDTKMIAEMTAVELNEGKNTLQIIAAFKDKNGKDYVEQKEIVIERESAGLWQKIKGFFGRIFS